MTESKSLADFGAKVEAPTQEEQCQAFDVKGNRCPFKRQEAGAFCPDCSAEDALLTLGELSQKISVDEHTHYLATSVKDILRDNYDFPPHDAIRLASGSAVSTCLVLEGRLAKAARDGTETFTVRQHEYHIDQARELLDQVRSNITSSTFAESWQDSCHVVGKESIRCSGRPSDGNVCSFHKELDEAEFLISDYLDEFGPDTGGFTPK